MPAHRSIFDAFMSWPFRILFSFSCLNHNSNYSSKVRHFCRSGLNYTVGEDASKSNCTITRLCRQGQLPEARKVFDITSEPDVISWTSLIAGYAKRGMMEEARTLFDRLDAKKSVVTWTAMINGYVKTGRSADAEKLFEEIPEKNVITWNTMIHGCVKCGDIQKALRLFDEMDQRNAVSWNTILVGLLEHGMIEEANRIFSHMPEKTVISWTTMVSGLSANGRINEARILFDKMPVRNVVSWNAMITGYTRNLRLNEAFDLFESMPEKNISSWNAMIAGCILGGDMRRARWLFADMPERNVVSWTAMIDGFVQNNQSEEAMLMFHHMLADSKVKPNERTYVCVLSACSDVADLVQGKQIHQIIAKTPYQNSKFVLSAILSMYSKCGELQTAKKLFDYHVTGCIDLVCLNSMIAAYAFHGCGRETVELFEQISSHGIKPDEVTYLGLLSACSHSGLVQEGLKYFAMLVNDKSIKLREDHLTTLVDLCSRAGRLREALEFIQQLPMNVSAFTLGTLIAGFNIQTDAVLKKEVAEKLIQAEPENAGSYTLLSNIFASNRQWQEAARLRTTVKEMGLKKQPGCSWIQVGDQVRVFVVGGKPHLDTVPVQNILGTLYLEMKKSGYDFTKQERFGIGVV